MADIVTASYEGGLHGWETITRARADGGGAQVDLKLRFSFGAHIGCVRAIAISPPGCSKRLLVSGGNDEIIRIYDLDEKISIGELQRHVATISSLEFVGRSGAHLLSASIDGAICMWRTRDWACVHMLGGHKGEVSMIRAHPSARMALSVSVDRTMRLWNLVEGRIAFIKRAKHGAAQVVCWSAPRGDRYALASGRVVSVFQTAATSDGDDRDGNGEIELEHPRRVNALVFLGGSNCANLVRDGGGDDESKFASQERLLATAGDDGILRIFDVGVGAGSSGASGIAAMPHLLRQLSLSEPPSPLSSASAASGSAPHAGGVLRVKGLATMAATTSSAMVPAASSSPPSPRGAKGGSKGGSKGAAKDEPVDHDHETDESADANEELERWAGSHWLCVASSNGSIQLLDLRADAPPAAAPLTVDANDADDDQPACSEVIDASGESGETPASVVASGSTISSTRFTCLVTLPERAVPRKPAVSQKRHAALTAAEPEPEGADQSKSKTKKRNAAGRDDDDADDGLRASEPPPSKKSKKGKKAKTKGKLAAGAANDASDANGSAGAAGARGGGGGGGGGAPAGAAKQPHQKPKPKVRFAEPERSSQSAQPRNAQGKKAKQRSAANGRRPERSCQ